MGVQKLTMMVVVVQLSKEEAVGVVEAELHAVQQTLVERMDHSHGHMVALAAEWEQRLGGVDRRAEGLHRRLDAVENASSLAASQQVTVAGIGSCGWVGLMTAAGSFPAGDCRLE